MGLESITAGRMRCGGKAVLVISSDLAKIVRISDRILVMANKTIVWNQPNPGVDQAVSEAIMHRLV